MGVLAASRSLARATLAAAFLFAGVAHAQSGTDLERARAAYDRGVRAHAAQNHLAAARAFSEADALAPSPASLEAALESAMRADDAPLGAELVDRAEGRATDAGVARSLAAAKKRFAGRTGKIKVDCRGAAPCLASVDGIAANARKTIYVLAGPHDVVVQRNERLEKLVDVKADTTAIVGGAEPVGVSAPVEPPPPPPPVTPIEATPGISPIWFFAGLGLTAVAGVFTIGSGVDASHEHDTFASQGCAPGATGPRPASCDQQSADGKSAQLRTNVLLGTTAVLAAATAAVGIFVVRWNGDHSARLQLGVTRFAATAGFEIVTP